MYFNENEENFQLHETYSCVGSYSIDGKEYFLHKKAIVNGEETQIDYDGNLILTSNGTFEEDKCFINEIIIPQIGLQTICAVSLSSAIVGMMREKDLRFILHIEGESTTGKTTSLMLAGSIWGNPKIAPNGIIRNWNTTGNKLVQSISGNNGIILGLDELSMAKIDSTQITYLLTGGSDKQRMYEDNDNTEFRTAILSTGEIQLKDSNYGGIAARLFEIKRYNFTKDKETADIILEKIQKSYGNIGYEFAKALTAYSAEQILSKVQSLTQKVIAKIESYVTTNGKLYEIIVLYNQFENIMTKIGYPNTKPLIKALKKKGLITCEEGKNYSRRKVGNQSKVKVIVINATAINGGIDNENQD